MKSQKSDIFKRFWITLISVGIPILLSLFLSFLLINLTKKIFTELPLYIFEIIFLICICIFTPFLTGYLNAKYLPSEKKIEAPGKKIDGFFGYWSYGFMLIRDYSSV